MPTCTLTKAQVALVQELCEGVVEIIADLDEDSPLLRALQDVKEDVEQTLLSRAYSGQRFPRHTYEQDRKPKFIPYSIANQERAKFKERVTRMKAEEKVREKKAALKKLCQDIRTFIDRAEAVMEVEKDPKSGHDILECIETLINATQREAIDDEAQ